jgi:cyclopropane fatty-acyl-phospholipid synthase-like methyltransferase
MKLRIPDLMGERSVDLEELATKSGAVPERLFRVLRVLESVGIVQQDAPKSYRLTSAGAILRSDVPGSMAKMAEWIADPLHFEVHAQFVKSVQAEVTTFDVVKGEPVFQWMAQPENNATAKLFYDTMTEFSNVCIPAMLEAYDFGQFKTIADVGGGHGAMLREMMKKHPHVNGFVADMPSVMQGAESAISDDGLSTRCRALPCDFFKSVPAGADAYFLKFIIHDWNDEQSVCILRNIRQVVPANGKVILAESVLDDTPQTQFGRLLDIEMMAFPGGKERTEAEFAALFEQSGFRLSQVVPTKSPLSLIEAVPV